MTRIVYIEVLDERSRLKERIRLDRLPAVIGRGYDSDVILDDPYVSPSHLRVVVDSQGTLLAEDLESLNGLHDVSQPGAVARLELRSGTRLRVGRTTLRFLDPGHPIAATLADARTVGGARRHLLSARMSVALASVALALFTLLAFLGNHEKEGFAQSVTAGLMIVSALALWAGCWSLANRLVSHRFNFVLHVGLAATAAVVLLTSSQLTEWLDFLLPAADGFPVMGATVALVVFGGLLYGHLLLVTSLAHQMLWRSAFAVTGAIAGLIALSVYAADDPSVSQLPFSATLKPLHPRFVRTISLDEFAAAAAALKERADKVARER
ncbi:MAG: FHA domain-containing protein [Gemmatimonadaceae bacterium]